MQSVSGYPSDLTVTEPAALVVVNGAPLDVESVSVSRELSSSLPNQLNAGSGITAATGNVSWAVGEDVQTRAAHPWDGNSFPPKPADDVVVFMGYGTALARQLTGTVDDSQGSIADGDVSSALVDPIDKLNRDVSFPALLNAMPPIEDGVGAAGEVRHVGMQSVYITDRVLRACGFYATPQQTSQAVVSAPNMGSSWPETGTVTQSYAQGNTQVAPIYEPTSWGIGMTSGDVRYAPNLLRAGGDGRLNRTVQISVKVEQGPAAGGESFVRAYWGQSYIGLAVTATREVRAIRYNGETSFTVCTMSAANAADADVFMLRITSTGTVTLFANNGRSSTGTTNLGSPMIDTDMSSVRVYVTHTVGPRIGGVQVNYGPTNVVNFSQTAVLTPPGTWRPLDAFPRVVARNALDLLKEQAEAECAAMWIDERGVFRWSNRLHLEGMGTAATITALDDVLDIGWESSASDVRSEVILTSSQPIISRSRTPNQLAWQGRGSSLDVGETIEEIATPPADTDWVGVDELLRRLPGSSVPYFNRGRGTYAGAVATNEDGSQWATINNSSFSVGMEKIADVVYKFTAHAGSPPDGRTVELRTPDEDSGTAVWQSKRNLDLPILRAKAIVEWVDEETVGAHPGPPNAATLQHSVGPWVQHPDSLQSLADWLSLRVRRPAPVIRNLSVIPDFRRQLGDIVRVQDPENMRIQIWFLITKIDTTVSAGSAEQTIGGRILQVEPYGASNAQFDTHNRNRTNTGIDTLWSGATNEDLDNNPLGRG